MNEYIYKLKDGSFVFGLKIDSIISLSVLNIDEQSYLREFKKKLSSLVTSLINNTNYEVVFDYRLNVSPNKDHYTYGNCEFHILCKIKNTNLTNSILFLKGFNILFSSTFNEYEISLLYKKEIELAIDKFPIKHIYQIVRRCSEESLHTLVKNRNPIGFTSSRKENIQANNSKIDYIFPFIYEIKQLHHLLTLLLKHDSRIAISCRFSPTNMTEIEEQFLEKQIVICDRFAKFRSEYLPEDINLLHTILQEQAKIYQQQLTKNLYGMRDNCCLMVLEIASQKKISSLIIDSIGSLITEPAGSDIHRSDFELMNYLAGGFEVIDLGGSRSYINAYRNLIIKTPKLQDIKKQYQRIPFLYDTYQAISLLRLPPSSEKSIPWITNKLWMAKPAPNNMDRNGVLIGSSKIDGTENEISLGNDERFKHSYIVGQTGTGKSTLLKTMILDDIKKNNGVCVIDPHGDLYSDILLNIPSNRIKDVILIDPTDIKYPIGLNLLECDDEKDKHFIIQEFTEIIRRLVEDEYEQGGVMVGPIFMLHLRMNLLLIMSDRENPGTLIDLYNIFFVKDYWKKWIPLKVDDELLKRWTEGTLPNMDYLRTGSDGSSMGGYVGSKFEGFVFDPIMRNIFSQQKSTIDFSEIMNNGKIVLINLARGALSDTNSRLLGMIILAKIQAATMGRTKLPKNNREPFHLYVDEFQNIATQNFISMLSEARKYNVSLVLANQFLSQLKNTKITKSIFGNVGTIISFRLGQEDAVIMKAEMGDVFSVSELTNFPNWHASVSTIFEGETVQPFTIQTIPIENKKSSCKKEIISYSRKNYSIKR